MTKLFRFTTVFSAFMFLVACGGGENIGSGNENNPDPEIPTEKSPFRVEVLDITATAARVSVFPTEQKSKYYFDILQANYYNEYNEQFGFQRFIDNTINSLMTANSMTKEDVLSRILSVGDDSYGFTTLKADSEYYAVAMGIDESGMITTKIVAVPFKTEAAKQSDNTFNMQVSGITYNGASYTVTPTNKTDKYVLIPWNKPIVDQLGDKFIEHCLNTRSDIEDYVVSGVQQGRLDSCVPGRDYYLVAFGYEGGLATTALEKVAFTTKIGSNPAECTFTFAVSNIQYDRADMTVTPSAKHIPFFWNVVEKNYYNDLVCRVGATEAMKSVLADTMKPFAADFGNLHDALEMITSYSDVNIEGTTYGLAQGTEYIPWAVVIDNEGNAAAEFVMGESFTTKSDIVAECKVTVKGSWETGSDGKAVLISTVTPDSKCAGFYNVIFQGDLSGASRQSLLNNIIRDSYFKNLNPCIFDKCAWNQVVTAVAVGFDTDGNFGEIAMDIFTPKKEQ